MRALIDTSTFLWTISDNDKLSGNARRFIADMENEIFISVASLWEIAIKTSLGKLELLLPFNRLIPEQLEQNSITILPIEIQHLSKIIDLPLHATATSVSTSTSASSMPLKDRADLIKTKTAAKEEK